MCGKPVYHLLFSSFHTEHWAPQQRFHPFFLLYTGMITLTAACFSNVVSSNIYNLAYSYAAIPDNAHARHIS